MYNPQCSILVVPNISDDIVLVQNQTTTSYQPMHMEDEKGSQHTISTDGSGQQPQQHADNQPDNREQ